MSDLVLTMLEKAKAEIETLHTHLEHRSDANTQLRAEIERLRTETQVQGREQDELLREIERLKAALRHIAECDECDYCLNKARAALEGKQ